MMSVIRLSNVLLIGRNLHPEYLTFLSCYRVEKRQLASTRIFNSREKYSTTQKSLGYDVHRMIHDSPKLAFLPKMPKLGKIPTMGKMPSVKFPLNFLNKIRMDELKNAPEPVFWYSTVCLLPLVAPPLSFLIFGYSPGLASLQLVFGATLCSFIGGIKWGYTISGTEQEKPTWENLGWAMIPQVIGWMALLMPQMIGFLMSAGGIYLTTYRDLTTPNYPPWFKSIRVMVAIPAIIGLLISFIIRIFH